MDDNIEVEIERIDRPPGFLFGRTLNKLRGQRIDAVANAKSKMLKHHKIGYKELSRYKIVEDRIVHRDGHEVIELRLYELKDAAVVTINTSVVTDLSAGINKLREFSGDE